jgi:hypothetical protein
LLDNLFFIIIKAYNKSMYQKILNFIKYNNAFTIIFIIFFFSFGVSFAASPGVRDSVYASQSTVVSVDNNLIVSTDLDSFNFNLRINSVTEDEKNYYAAYSYQTLAVEDGVWQTRQIQKTLTVSKEALGGKDLGLYIAKELGENINYELSYLKKVQKLEIEKGKSQKVVNTEYSGLIGKLLDPKQEVIEGYSPVIPEPAPEVAATVESNPAAVILSNPHVPPSPKAAVDEIKPTSNSTGSPEATPSSPDLPVQTEATTTPPQTEPAPEPVSTSTSPQTEPAPEPVPTSTPPETTTTPTQATEPTSTNTVDEKLVKEVVEKLQSEATPDSTSSPQTTP